MVESARDIIVANVDFFRRVGDTKVPNPDQMDHEGGCEDELWLIALVGPIVDSIAPWLGATGTIKDGAWVLVRVIQIDNALRRQMHVGDKVNQVLVHNKDVTTAKVLDQGL